MERNGAPKLSRKHDFQRIVDRSENNSSSPTDLRKNTQRPDMGVSTRRPNATRAMTTPDMYIAIPPTNASKIPRYTHDVPRIGVFSVSDVTEKDDDSDASSICHSPSWDDAETKRLRKIKQEVKEKRRKEKERVAKEAKKAENTTKRLSKAPPTNRFSKMVISDRSSSAPAIPTLSGISREKGGSKNGSVDLNRFTDVANGIPGPWNTPEKTVRSSDGFIGGLKLKRLEQRASQERKGEQPSTIEKIRTFASAEDEKPGENAGVRKSGGKMAEIFSHRSFPSLDGPILEPLDLPATPIKENGSIPEPKPDMTAQNTSPSHSSQKPPRTSRKSRTSSQEKPPLSYREPLELADVPRGRERSSSYARNQRQQYQDSSAFEDEKRISTATESTKSRGRSWSIASLTRRARKSTSKTRPSTGNSENSTASNDGENYHAFLVDNYTSSQAIPLKSSSEERPVTAKSSASTFKGFRNVAKAFSRHSTISKRSTIIPESSNDPTTRLKSMVSTLSLKSASSKADRILGASVTSLMEKSSSTLALGERSRASTLDEIEKELQSPSRSTIGSSEGFPDESTNASTPTVSRPQSHKRTSRETSQKSPTSPMMSGGIPYDESTRIDEEHLQTPIAKQTEERLVTPVAKKETKFEEEHLKTPVAKQTTIEERPVAKKETKIEEEGPKTKKSSSFFQFKGKGKAVDQPEPKTEIQRVPSLSKSISTPDLQQDLSFLPELKHQSLSRGKQKETNLPVIQTRPEKSMTTRSEGSSPISPLIASSQHLQNARLNIPSAPPKRRFPNKREGPTQMANIDPIAKMFVVCCSCRYFHDMPSKLYECMAKPDNVVEDRELGVSGLISTAVKCPWCAHGMSTGCCEGYAAVVYLKERLH